MAKKVKWSRSDFNRWRNEYNSYSFDKQKEIANELETLYPIQQHFTASEVLSFLSNIQNPKVLEIGGYKGELASQTLAKNKSIDLWHNYDICSNAIDKSICKDKRYKPILLIDFAWNLDIFSEYNVCILSHIVEHINELELKKLFVKIKSINYFYIEAPLRKYGYMWENYAGTHILEGGWVSIGNMLKDYNETIVNNNIRTYSLKSSGRLPSTSKQ